MQNLLSSARTQTISQKDASALTTIREITPNDRSALKQFFLGLSDETIFKMSYFDSRFGKTNSEIGAQVASDLLTSPANQFPEDQFIVLAEELEIQGLAWLEFTPWKPTEKYTCSLGIMVGDKHQRRGIGTELMLELVREAKKRNMRKIWLRVYSFNQPAIDLYRKFGFEQEGYFDRQEWKEEGDGQDVPLGVVSMGKWL